jgi:hypothetical protein
MTVKAGRSSEMLFEEMEAPKIPKEAREMIALIQKQAKATLDLCARFNEMFPELAQGNPTTGRIAYFDCKHRDRFNEPAVISQPRDNAIMKNLVNRYGIEKVDAFIDLFFLLDDGYVLQRGFTIGTFQTQVSRLIAQSKTPPKLAGVTRNTQDNRQHAAAAGDLIRRQYGSQDINGNWHHRAHR